MSVQTLSEYEVFTTANQRSVVCAESLSDAAGMIETESVVLVQVTRIKESVQVNVPDTDVRFRVTIDNDAAIAAGCVALPESYIVAPGAKVIMQAIAPTDSGFEFTGWYRGVTLLSADETAEITIVAPTGPDIEDTIIARFEAAT